MNVRGPVRLLAVAALAGALCVACGDDEGGGGGGSEPEFTLGVSMIDLSNPFFVSMREAGNIAAEEYNVEAIWQSADGSLEKQIGIVENFIAQDVDAILINAVDDKGIEPAL